MASSIAEDEFSDDEIFIGKLTLKEIRKRLLPDQKRQTTTCSNTNNKENVSNDSIQIIETRSEPDLEFVSDMNDSIAFKSFSDRYSCWDIKSNDDTFLNLEKMVMEQSQANTGLDNTLDVVNFILENADKEKPAVDNDNEKRMLKEEQCNIYEKITAPISSPLTNGLPKGVSCNKDLSDNKILDGNFSLISTYSNEQDILEKEGDYLKWQDKSQKLHIPTNNTHNVESKSLPLEDKTLSDISYITPTKEQTKEVNSGLHTVNDHYEPLNELKNIQIHEKVSIVKTIDFDTDYCMPEKNENIYREKQSIPMPSSNNIPSTPFLKVNKIDDIFVTPKNVASTKKNLASSIKKSPGTINNFKHVVSPVAFYINCGPQVPLLRNALPQTIPKVSGIPKLIKNPVEVKATNKENVELPKLAYRSAKKTAVVKLTNNKCLPGQWAKKLNVAEAVVEKHTLKQTSHSVEPIIFQEDSFNNLSHIPQADLSIHTQTSAFTKLK